MPEWNRRHAFRIACITIGAAGGAMLAFVTTGPSTAGLRGPGALSRPAALAIVVHAAYGALVGWAITALIAHFTRPRP